MGASLGGLIALLPEPLDCPTEAQNPPGTQRAGSGQGCMQTLNPPSEPGSRTLLPYCPGAPQGPSGSPPLPMHSRPSSTRQKEPAPGIHFSAERKVPGHSRHAWLLPLPPELQSRASSQKLLGGYYFLASSTSELPLRPHTAFSKYKGGASSSQLAPGQRPAHSSWKTALQRSRHVFGVSTCTGVPWELQSRGGVHPQRTPLLSPRHPPVSAGPPPVALGSLLIVA